MIAAKTISGNYPSINKRVLPRTTITEYASTVLVPRYVKIYIALLRQRALTEAL